jgi:CubicO group peptidase (beta-lactamase class C family)
VSPRGHETLDAVGAKLEELAKRQGVPGAAVGVDLAGETRFAAHGVTHVDHPLPVDERTLFQIASNSKPFTATLVLSLVGEGAVGLDDPVREHLPELRMPDARHDAAVTVRHLLTHRVGWDGDALFIRQPEPPTLDAIFEPMTRARQLVPPGGPWTYSNAAFSVAGRLVERKTGRSFPKALRERILEPLGMARTVTSSDEAIFHRVAMRHLSIPERAPVALPGGGWQRGWELSPLDVPAGGLVSCAEDLLRWLRFWLGRGEGAVPGLTDALRDEALVPQVEHYNPVSGQAIGWALRHDPAARVYQHGGLTAGYCSYTLFAPALDLAAVVLTNGTSGAPVHDELTKWLVGEIGGTPWSDPAPLEPQPALTRYAGDYWGAFGTVRVRAVDGELELATERHATDDGSWQPPPEPPMRLRLYQRDFAIATAPERFRGIRVDFDPTADPPAWLRTGGRICVRE